MPSLPKITPIPFIERAAPFDDPNFIFELKYDGFRAVAYVNNGNAKFRGVEATEMQTRRAEWAAALRAREQLSTMWTGTPLTRNRLLARRGRAIAPSTLWTAASAIV